MAVLQLLLVYTLCLYTIYSDEYGVVTVCYDLITCIRSIGTSKLYCLNPGHDPAGGLLLLEWVCQISP